MKRQQEAGKMRSATRYRLARWADQATLAALAALATGVPLVVAATGAAEEAIQVRYGAEVTVGHGVARSYIVMKGGAVEEVGVALSEGALHGLPQVDGHAGQGGHAGADENHDAPPGHREFILAMPADHGTSFRFVGLDWNPLGHPPEGIYDAPHFDIHFYTISEAERNLIDRGHPDFATKASRVPDMAGAPAGYLPHHLLEQGDPATFTVPRMGLHWINPAGAEFAGEPFTASLLYGSWDGAFIFLEPMVARDFLLGNPDFSLPFASWYGPGVLRVYRDGATSEYRIAVRDLETR